ncbi:MAG: hypothetical protein RL497_2665 [Pseudomonadota bacterium]|jgi:hypothetical protein
MNNIWEKLLALAILSCSMNGFALDLTEEPIARIGHGGFFDTSGKQIPVTVDFAERSQLWYREAILEQLTESEQKQFLSDEKQALEGLNEDRQAQMIMRHQLLQNALTGENKTLELKKIGAKLNALRYEMDWTLPTKGSVRIPKIKYEFKLSDTLLERLQRFDRIKDLIGDDIFKFTINSGQAYINECRNAGVPIPPPINQMDPTGLTGWRVEGFIPQSLQFIVGTPAELRSYRSITPEGMCYALPRYTDSTRTQVSLDGVICLGKQSSNMCVWDNQMPNAAGQVRGFTFGASEIIPIGVPSVPGGKYQAGGAEIEFGNGGECTDCHAGENPYIVHPRTTLRTTPAGAAVSWQSTSARSGGDLPTFSLNRYIPLVGASWPQNQSSLTAAATPGACGGCHVKASAGRLPHLSNQIPGYCNTVLALAGLRTMPPSSPGSQVATVNSLISSHCNAAPNASVEDVGDPHIQTVNGTRYDFQAAGEFTLLKNGDSSFEVQSRQTPVLVNFALGTNPHTGLSSCPSLNTAIGVRVGKTVVSYQPKGGAFSSRESLSLFIDGSEMGAGFYDLGAGNSLNYSGAGSTVEITLADKSKVRIYPRKWESQGYWYLDVHIDNTPAREGVMGLITEGDWLPRAPDSTSFGPRPLALDDRHQVLNQKFADAWRVTDSSSLFYYAPGTSTFDFTDPDWPSAPGKSCDSTRLKGDLPKVEKPNVELARKVCSNIKNETIRENCYIDVSVMGETQAAEVHLKADANN